MPYYLTGNVTCYNDLYCPKLKEKNKKIIPYYVTTVMFIALCSTTLYNVSHCMILSYYLRKKRYKIKENKAK